VDLLCSQSANLQYRTREIIYNMVCTHSAMDYITHYIHLEDMRGQSVFKAEFSPNIHIASLSSSRIYTVKMVLRSSNRAELIRLIIVVTVVYLFFWSSSFKTFRNKRNASVQLFQKANQRFSEDETNNQM